MKRIVWTVLLLTVCSGLVAWGQCICSPQDGPECYMTFRTNEVVGISLIVPMDFFMAQDTTIPPKILGWRIETWSGMVIRAEFFAEGPLPNWTEIEWNLEDQDGTIVDPGYYRVVVETTAGDADYPVRIIERCRPCCGCWCWWAQPNPCAPVCCIPYGRPYLELSVADTRPCSLLTFTLNFHFECASP